MSTQADPISILMTSFSGMLLFISGAYHEILRGLVASFAILPAGRMAFQPGWVQYLVERSTSLFGEALRIALPLVIIILATQLSFGLLSKIAPALNLWSIGFLITIVVTVLCLIVYGPTLMVELSGIVRRSVEDFHTVVSG